MKLEALTAGDLAAVMAAYRAALQTHQGTINRLNVFPVPDGDTGTNLLLTLDAVGRELATLEPPPEMSAVCAAVAKGSLMGARGNSGVILCQVLRALVAAAAESDEIGPTALAAALSDASSVARSAVSRPVEGTILTVAAGAAEAAGLAAAAGADLVGVVEAAGEGAGTALRSTPSLLPVLADAGVVDAGGAGLTLLFSALLHTIDGRPLPTELDLPPDVAAVVASAEVAVSPAASVDPTCDGPQFEVMFLLDANDKAVPALRARFDEIGDSTVIVGSSPMFSCHVHTDDIGAAIEAGIEAGRPHEIRVTDLREQVEEERWVREAEGEIDPAPRGAPPRTSVVAVATGAGIRRIFSSLGVARLVAGGQSMNPSTAEILDMTESAPGSEVVLLPNNKNIFPVAEQVAGLSTKAVYVVPTLGVQEGLAGFLLAYDPAASGEENAELMRTAASHVVAGEITQAIRDSNGPTGPIKEGSWLGISRSGIEVVDQGFVEAALALVERLVAPEHEIVTLIEGNAADRVALDEVERRIGKSYPELAIERHVGGQPLYPLLISVE